MVVPASPYQLQPSPGRMIHAIKKPKKPTMISIKPVIVSGKLWPAILFAEPSALNFPIRGPRLTRTPKAKNPATA